MPDAEKEAMLLEIASEVWSAGTKRVQSVINVITNKLNFV